MQYIQIFPIYNGKLILFGCAVQQQNICVCFDESSGQQGSYNVLFVELGYYLA